jgi:predicted Na+-dependent transporter
VESRADDPVVDQKATVTKGSPKQGCEIGHPLPPGTAPKGSLMIRRCREGIREYRELAMVAVAAVLGLTFQGPLLQVVHHQGLDVLLAVLVFSTAIGIEPNSLRQLLGSWPRLSIALVVGASALPALSWLVAHVVPPGSLRDGVSSIGLAPCEIASIATTSMAGGDVALAGGVLIGSTVMTVLVAGPILSFETPGASLHPAGIIINLAAIVMLPLVAGVTVRFLTPLPTRGERFAATTSTLAVAALVALIAAEVRLSTKYVPVLIAILMFLFASTLIGRLVGLGARRPVTRAMLLTTSMRDFAIAAAIAAAAFGSAAAAPLGIYGIVVLIWGTGSAGFMRSRSGDQC